jgi:hypothetical protein
MINYMGVRCGAQCAASVRPPGRCAICEDEHEGVYCAGQQVLSSYTSCHPFRKYHPTLPVFTTKGISAPPSGFKGGNPT